MPWAGFANIIHDKTIVNFLKSSPPLEQWHCLIKKERRYHRELRAEMFLNWLCRRSIALSRRGKYFLMIMTQNGNFLITFLVFRRNLFLFCSWCETGGRSDDDAEPHRRHGSVGRLRPAPAQHLQLYYIRLVTMSTIFNFLLASFDVKALAVSWK